MPVRSDQYAHSTQMVLSFYWPCASRNFSVCATLKFITFLPFTVFVMQSFPRLPITCSLIILKKFSCSLKKLFEQQFTLFTLAIPGCLHRLTHKVYPKI